MPASYVRQTARFLRVAVLLTVFAAAAAQSQQTNAIRVKLSGTCRDIHTADLILILNDDERVPAHLHTADPARLVWTGEWHDPDDRRVRFAAEGSHASLRFGGARSDCRRSVPERHDDSIEAVFTFDCDENPAFDLKIQAEPSILFSYKRSLRTDKTKDLDCDSAEQAGSYRGTRTILDVRLAMEVVSLGLEDSRRNIQWMLLNDLPVVKKRKKGVSDTLDHDRVVDAIVKSTPRAQFVPNEYEVGRKNDTIKPDTKITLTVN